MGPSVRAEKAHSYAFSATTCLACVICSALIIMTFLVFRAGNGTTSGIDLSENSKLQLLAAASGSNFNPHSWGSHSGTAALRTQSDSKHDRRNSSSTKNIPRERMVHGESRGGDGEDVSFTREQQEQAEDEEEAEEEAEKQELLRKELEAFLKEEQTVEGGFGEGREGGLTSDALLPIIGTGQSAGVKKVIKKIPKPEGNVDASVIAGAEKGIRSSKPPEIAEHRAKLPSDSVTTKAHSKDKSAFSKNHQESKDSSPSSRASKPKPVNNQLAAKAHVTLKQNDPIAHNYHPRISPRPGSDLDTNAKKDSLLHCHNQAKCVVPALQLKQKARVYLCLHPANHGVRFYFLIKEGLVLHPNVELMTNYTLALQSPEDGGAHYVFYLPGSSPWHKTECTNASLASKLIVLDEFDGHNLFYPYRSSDEVAAVYGPEMIWYNMYFKRSFVARRDGMFLSHPHLDKQDVYPLTYAVAEAYLPEQFTFERNIEILCTLRGSKRMPTRLRVLEWVQEYVQDRKVEHAAVGQIDKATRSTLNKNYFSQMYQAEIVITVNPSNWEGDFRLWESFATGALVFVDPIFVPHPHALLHGVHCIFYHNSNKTELFEKLDYYRQHKEEARRIAIDGYLHALKFHRTVNLVDYVLRSAHVKAVLVKRQAVALHTSARVDKGMSVSRPVSGEKLEEVPEYTYTAQYLNHQTKDQSAQIKQTNLPAKFMEVLGLHHYEHQPHSLDHMKT